MVLLEQVRHELQAPVWINADILAGPGGKATPLEPQAFLDAVHVAARNAVFSLGWTTGWSPNTDNPGELVHAEVTGDTTLFGIIFKFRLMMSDDVKDR